MIPTRHQTEEVEPGFGPREWFSVLLMLVVIALGATAVFGAAYWLLNGL